MKFFREMAVIFICVMVAFSCCQRVSASRRKTMFPVADSYVSSGQPDLSHGSEGSLFVSNNFLEERMTFIMFNLAEFPLSVNVKSTKLLLYANWVFAVHNVSVFYCPYNEWSESNLTWLNKPYFSDIAICSVNVNRQDAWYEWDVTAVVKAAYERSDKRISFALRTSYYYNTTYADFVEFFSKDEFVFNEYRPRLIVEHEDGIDVAPSPDMTIMLYILGGFSGVALAIILFKIEDRLEKLANRYSEQARKILSKLGWTSLLIVMLGLLFLFLFLPYFGFPLWIEWFLRIVFIGIVVGIGIFAMAHRHT